MTSETAVFYRDATVDGLKRAIGEFEGRSFDPSELRGHCRRFSEDAFINGFQDVLARAMQAP